MLLIESMTNPLSFGARKVRILEMNLLTCSRSSQDVLAQLEEVVFNHLVLPSVTRHVSGIAQDEGGLFADFWVITVAETDNEFEMFLGRQSFDDVVFRSNCEVAHGPQNISFHQGTESVVLEHFVACVYKSVVEQSLNFSIFAHTNVSNDSSDRFHDALVLETRYFLDSFENVVLNEVVHESVVHQIC